MERKTEYTEKAKAIYTKDSIPNLDPGFFLFNTPSDSIDEKDILQKPYMYHPWVNSAVRTISTNISQLQKILKNKNDPEKNITQHEILETFDSPNYLMPSSIIFWQAVITILLLNTKDTAGGQVFLIPMKGDQHVNLQKGEIPDTWMPFNDSWVKPNSKKAGEFKAWILKPPGANDGIEYFPEEIVRIHLFNPYDYFAGLSYFTPQAVAFAQDVQSSIYNKSFLENGAALSGLLTSDQHLTKEQYYQYLGQWNENFGGNGNVGKTALLGMGLKYQPYASSHVDMQYQEQKKWNKDQTLSAFGVNKIAIGDYEDINFATIKEGRKILWQDTYKPLDILMTQAITNQWIRYIDKNLVLTSDYDAIPALQKDYKTLAAASGDLVTRSKFPPELAAKTVGIKISDEDLKKWPHLSENPTPATPDFSEEDNSAKFINKRYHAEKQESLTPEERIELSWDYINKVLLPGEKEWITTMNRFFVSQRNRMQDKVDEWLKNSKTNSAENKIFLKALALQLKSVDVTPAAFLLNRIEEDKKLIALVEPLVLKQMKREEARLKRELGSLIEFSANDTRVDNFIQDRTSIYSQINNTTFKSAREKISRAVAVAIETNATPQEAAKLIKTAISDVGEVRKNQAQTIARTETSVISSTARFDAFKVEGVEWHEWLNAADEKVRTDHTNKPTGVGGEVVRIGDIFPIVNMRFPLDPMGSLDQIVNCRCVAIAARQPNQ